MSATHIIPNCRTAASATDIDWTVRALNAETRVTYLEHEIKDFLRGLDRGYFHCDQTTFVDSMREAVR